MSIFKKLLPICILVILTHCKKADSNKNKVDTSGSSFVSNLNGFEYVGSFEEPEAPVDYRYPRVVYIDDYQGNDRMVVVSEKDPFNPPRFYKWYVLNYKDKKLTQTYTTADGFGDNDGNYFNYLFDHPTFTLKTWYKPGHYYWELKPNQQERVYIVSAGSQFESFLINNHLIRKISETSWWPYNTNSQTDEKQFLLTGEKSAMKVIDYFFDSTYETEAENSIYTGYFYPSNDGNWIGISKGNTSLDTLLISKDPVNFYNLSACATYIEKVGNKLYLAFIKNKLNPNTQQDLSMYELNLSEKIIKPLLENMSLPSTEAFSATAFRNGKLYVFPAPSAADPRPYNLNSQGVKAYIEMPVLNQDVSVQRSFFGKKYWYLVLYKDLKRIEIYKKDLFQ